jgi:hypothetical protein
MVYVQATSHVWAACNEGDPDRQHEIRLDLFVCFAMVLDQLTCQLPCLLYCLKKEDKYRRSKVLVEKKVLAGGAGKRGSTGLGSAQ